MKPFTETPTKSGFYWTFDNTGGETFAYYSAINKHTMCIGSDPDYNWTDEIDQWIGPIEVPCIWTGKHTISFKYNDVRKIAFKELQELEQKYLWALVEED
jgi:hypothetical protein